MGTATAWPLSDNGHKVRLVGTHLDAEIIRSCKERGFHPRLKRQLPEGVRPFFVEEIARIYQAPLLVAKPPGSPFECWQRKGWPFLGKLPARIWMQKHRGRSYGFRLNVTACCHAHKLAPVRKLIRAEGFRVKLAGIRGEADDKLRGLRAHKDGPIYRNRESGTIQAHPLLLDETLAKTPEQESEQDELLKELVEFQRGLKAE